MGLTVVTGPAQAGKTQACIEALAGSAAPEIILICATTYLSDSLGRRRALARLRRSVAPAAEVPAALEVSQVQSRIVTMTFRDLTAKLWGLYGDERAFIGQAAREALVDELLETSDLARYAESLRTAGGRRLIIDLAQTCAATEAQGIRGVCPAPLRTLMSRYYEQVRKRDFIEPDAALIDLARRGVFLDAAYGFLGFTDFPAAQRAYVEMLWEHTEVAVASTCEQTGAATLEGRRFVTEVAERYRTLCSKAADVREVAVFPADKGMTELCELRANFLREESSGNDAAPDPAHTAVRFVTAQGADEEILAVVREARNALDTIALQSTKVSDPEQTVSTDDALVALIFRHLGSKVTRLAQALDEYQIPAAFDLKVSFRQTGLGAALCALLRLPFAGDDLGAVASSYLLSVYSAKTQIQAAEIERCLREGHRGYGAYSEWLCARLGVADLRRQSAEGWAQIASDLLFRATTVERNDYLRQLDFAAHKLFLSLLAEQRDLELQAAGARSADPANSVSPALDPRKLLAGLMSAQVKLTPPPGSARALVSEASRVRGRQFHTVILASLAQQDFSASSELSLAERTTAQLMGRKEPDKVAGEHQLWYDLLGCARQSLVLVSQSRDPAGQEMAPSAFLEELRYGVAGERAGIVAAPAPDSGKAARPPAPDLAPERTCAPVCPVRGHLTGLDFGEHATGPFAVTTLEYYARCHYSWFLGRYVARRTIRDNVDAINEGIILHSALQRFYEQAPRELGEAHVRDATLPRAHALLDRCFDAAWREQLGVESDVEAPEASQISLEALRGALQGFLEDEAAWMPGFTPRYFERVFGDADADAGNGEPAPTIAGVAVKGIIDRIDTYEPQQPDPELEPEVQVQERERDTPGSGEGAFFVIDYKRTGARHGGLLKARVNNKEIQATVYGLVARQLLAPLRYAGSAYRNIMNPKNLKIEHAASLRALYAAQMGFPEKSARGQWPAPAPIKDTGKKGEPSTYEKGIAGIEALVADAAAGLARGDAHITVPRDSGGEERDWCPFSDFCLYNGCLYYQKGGWS